MKKLILLMSLLLPTLVGARGKVNYEKKEVVTFTVSDNATLNLSNTYGDVQLYHWDKNVIQATVTIEVRAGTDEQAREVADHIQIQRSKNGNTVSIQTLYDPDNNSSFWKMFFGSSSNSRKDVHIDYKVYLPASLGKLNLRNRYGNVSGNQIPGNVNMELHYANFHLSGIQRALSLQVKYGDGSLTDIAQVNAVADYSDLRLDKIKNMNLQYSYGDLSIGNLGSLVVKGKYGDINIASVDQLTANTTYGDYHIRNIQTQGNIATAYGDVRIDQTGGNLQELKVDAKYSDISAGIGASQVRVEADLSYGDLDADISGLSTKENIQKGANVHFRAATSGGDNGAHIVITGAYSDIDLHSR